MNIPWLLKDVRYRPNRRSCCEDGRAELIAIRSNNGHVVAKLRCLECGGVGGGIPHKYVDPAGLPFLRDHMDQLGCEVCGAYPTEIHHWAPRAAFGADADRWPTSRLCLMHHRLWHQTIRGEPMEQDLGGRTGETDTGP